MLQDNITSLTNNVVLQNLSVCRLDIMFQQEGPPQHYFKKTRNYLTATYPDRSIGLRGPTDWPARSPDLTLLDYFLWGYVKSQAFKTV